MMMYFFIGQKALERANQCDSTQLRHRYQSGNVNNEMVFKKLRTRLFRKTKHRYVFYIMLNDGDFTFSDKSDKSSGPSGSSKVYFPGHVFVIEKFCKGNDELGFHLYQSYINQYDLKGYLEKAKQTFTYTEPQMRKLLDNLEDIFRKGKWDKECVRIWKKFTKVDSSNFIDSVFTNVLSVCFTYDRITHCLDNIEKYTKEKLKDVKTLPMNEVYGDSSLYNSRTQSLTNGEMSTQLSNIIQEIQKDRQEK
jgi:hypothetical protein